LKTQWTHALANISKQSATGKKQWEI